MNISKYKLYIFLKKIIDMTCYNTEIKILTPLIFPSRLHSPTSLIHFLIVDQRGWLKRTPEDYANERKVYGFRVQTTKK